MNGFAKCYELASYFLDGYDHTTDKDRDDLAQVIQQRIEFWMEEQDANTEASAQAYYDSYIGSKIDERRDA